MGSGSSTARSPSGSWSSAREVGRAADEVGERVSIPPAKPTELAAFSRCIQTWVDGERDANPLLLGVAYIDDERRWLVRLRGEEKAIITVWLTLGQQTLQYETYFMPAPEENVEACWEYLLRCNRRLFAMRFAIGVEDAVYLMGQMPLSAVDPDELDRIVGSAYAYSEQYFRPAMSIGFASRYRPPTRV